jgi:hypothetical protein
MDILDLSWRTTGQNVSCPQVLISLRMVDSQTQQTTLADLRESQGKQVLFPNIVAQLTVAERQELMQAIVDALVGIYQRRIGD